MANFLTDATFAGDISTAEKLIHSGATNTDLQFPGTNDQIVFSTNGSDVLPLDADKTATFAGTITIPDYIVHNGGTTTKFGFGGNDSFQVQDEWCNCTQH